MAKKSTIYNYIKREWKNGHWVYTYPNSKSAIHETIDKVDDISEKNSRTKVYPAYKDSNGAVVQDFSVTTKEKGKNGNFVATYKTNSHSQAKDHEKRLEIFTTKQAKTKLKKKR